MAKGIKYVKRAHLWVAYWTKNQKDRANELYWFSTREEAEKKLQDLLTIS